MIETNLADTAPVHRAPAEAPDLTVADTAQMMMREVVQGQLRRHAQAQAERRARESAAQAELRARNAHD